MEGYACSPDNIPKLLYRVDYPGAQVKFSSQSGFSAKDKTRTFSDRDLEDFARAIEYQFTWAYRQPLPFISLFSDLKHAQNWGCKTPWSPDTTASPPWTLYTIDTASISTTHTFFKLGDIVNTLRVTIPQGAQQHIKGAFVCLHGIPTSAIQESSTHTEVRQGMISAPLQRSATFSSARADTATSQGI